MSYLTYIQIGLVENKLKQSNLLVASNCSA